MGTDAVFDALDVNKDGKITPQEMSAGLGAVIQMVEVAKAWFLSSKSESEIAGASSSC